MTSCILSLKKIDYPNFEVVLVDNASKDGSPARLKEKFPDLVVIVNDRNLGYAEGNNVGIRYFLKKPVGHVLLLNNDTEVEPEFLSELVRASEKDPGAGILGSKIYYFDRPDRIWYAGGYLHRVTGKTYHRGLGKRDKGQYDGIAEVDFVSGCAMLIKREVLEALKGFDPDYFYSFEDVDLSLRARALGYRLLYVPSSRIRHKFARGSGGRFSPLYIYYRVRNGILFMKKNNFNWFRRSYSFVVNPLKMIAFALLTGNFKGARAALLGWLDYIKGRYGEARQ